MNSIIAERQNAERFLKRTALRTAIVLVVFAISASVTGIPPLRTIANRQLTGEDVTVAAGMILTVALVVLILWAALFAFYAAIERVEDL